jgi:hypothetical protein
MRQNRTLQLHTQLLAAAGLTVAAVVNIKAVVAVDMKVAEGNHLQLLDRTAVSKTSGGAYQLRRLLFVEAFPGALCEDERSGACCPAT